MANAILKTALKNAVVKTNQTDNYEFHLDNIRINGDNEVAADLSKTQSITRLCM